jgi:hypothetical protein
MISNCTHNRVVHVKFYLIFLGEILADKGMLSAAIYHLSSIHVGWDDTFIWDHCLLLCYLRVCLHESWHENRMKWMIELLSHLFTTLWASSVINSYVISECCKLTSSFMNLFISVLRWILSYWEYRLFFWLTPNSLYFVCLNYLYYFRFIWRSKCPRIYTSPFTSFLMQWFTLVSFHVWVLHLFCLLNAFLLRVFWKMIFFILSRELSREQQSSVFC